MVKAGRKPATPGKAVTPAQKKRGPYDAEMQPPGCQILKLSCKTPGKSRQYSYTASETIKSNYSRMNFVVEWFLRFIFL
jgi:hypothetical protein